MPPPSPAKTSDWKPLEHPLFRSLWIATVVSNIGSAMQDAVAPVFMTRLTTSAFVIALVQAAAALPIFLLSLPAGALADVLDRRRLLVATQIWMLGAAGLLGLLTFLHIVWPGIPAAPWILLIVTFVLGIGAAMSGPAFLRVLPELVPSDQMPSAMALNSIGLNTARAVGPALGGLAVALAGPGAAFVLNAISFAGVAWVLYHWRHPRDHHATSPERFLGAMRSGFRYARYSPQLRGVLLRVAVFICCASAMWSLAPVLATRELGLGVAGFCTLMAFLGVGAIVGIILMPRVQRRFATDTMVAINTILFAGGVLALAACRWTPLSCAIMFVIGANWVIILTNFNVATQRAVPAWVKGRAMSMYLLTLWGSWAAGAAFWGAIAKATSAHVALTGAGFGLAAGLLAVIYFRLVPPTQTDFAPAFKGGPLSPAAAAGAPVEVEIHYRIHPDRRHEFLALMREMRPQRLRNGASRWALENGRTEPGHFAERFSFPSAEDFARQRQRLTRADAQLEERALSFHVGHRQPSVHWTHRDAPPTASAEPARAPASAVFLSQVRGHALVAARRIVVEFETSRRRLTKEPDEHT